MPLLSAALLSLALPAPRPALPVLRSRVSVLRGGQTAMGLAGALGAAYEAQLSARPLLTQSLTAAATFALSDVTAQRLAPDGAGSDRTRTAVTALIGLCYFGPALYHYLRFITWLIPGTGLQSTLLKTFCGGKRPLRPAATPIKFNLADIEESCLALTVQVFFGLDTNRQRSVREGGGKNRAPEVIMLSEWADGPTVHLAYPLAQSLGFALGRVRAPSHKI